MVKIENEYGDKYTGKSSNAIYQQHYGRTIRRQGYKENHTPTPAQIKARNRFKEAITNIRQLTYDQVQTIKKTFRILKEKNPRSWPVNWYNFTKLCYIKQPKFEILNHFTNEYQVNYFNIYQVIEKNSIGGIIFDSGILSSPDTGTLLEIFNHTPDITVAEIELYVLPGVKHSYIIGEIETGSRFFDSRFFDSRFFA